MLASFGYEFFSSISSCDVLNSLVRFFGERKGFSGLNGVFAICRVSASLSMQATEKVSRRITVLEYTMMKPFTKSAYRISSTQENVRKKRIERPNGITNEQSIQAHSVTTVQSQCNTIEVKGAELKPIIGAVFAHI